VQWNGIWEFFGGQNWGLALVWFGLRLANSKPFGHFVVAEALARHVGLHPLAIDHELRDGALAGVFDDFIYGTRRGFDVYNFVGNVVLVEKTLSLAAVGAPRGSVNGKFHKPQRER